MKFLTYILLSFILFTFSLSVYKLYLVKTHPLKYKDEILLNSKQYDLEASLISSLINVESSFNPNAKSSKNAVGLMQIKLSTANYLNDVEKLEKISEEDLFIPEINIKYGCKYLRYLLNKFKDVNTTLCAYNAGETNVINWLKSDYSSDGKTLNYIPFEETRNYVSKIQNNILFYSKYFN